MNYVPTEDNSNIYESLPYIELTLNYYAPTQSKSSYL